MTKKRLIFSIIVALVLIQILPLLLETNPPVVAEPKWNSPQTRELAKRACFDCHSNETIWPWLVTLDVFRGRRHLNFSEWVPSQGGRGDGGLDEAVEQIQRGKMPLANYVSLHPAANLTETEKQQLIDGLSASGQ